MFDITRGARVVSCRMPFPSHVWEPLGERLAGSGHGASFASVLPDTMPTSCASSRPLHYFLLEDGSMLEACPPNTPMRSERHVRGREVLILRRMPFGCQIGAHVRQPIGIGEQLPAAVLFVVFLHATGFPFAADLSIRQNVLSWR